MRLSNGLAVRNSIIVSFKRSLDSLKSENVSKISLFKITGFCIALTCSIYAQAQPDDVKKFLPAPVPESPNVASLGKYGSYEVNMYNGLPDISIPIFEVKSGSLKLPITLSYHASGIKMTDVASWVGLGWSLSAGGQISRSVAGRPDELDFFNGSLIEAPSICQNYSDYQYILDSDNAIHDTQPDLFSFSFPGKSGKFMLRQNGQLSSSGTKPYMFIPHEPLAITAFFNDFTMLGEQGTIYKFGKSSIGDNAIESSSNNENLVAGNATSTWYLREIKSPNSDDEIKLNYQSIGHTSYFDMATVIWVRDDWTLEETKQQPGLPNTSNVDISTSADQLGLSEIIFDGGKVKFIANTARTDQTDLKALSTIEIYSETAGTYRLTKKISFIYSYFTGMSRLKLDEVQIRDNNNVVVDRYKFSYFTNSFSWDSYYKRDYWGYYNNANNTNLVPVQEITLQGTVSQTITIGGATSREANPQYLTEGVLKTITYPTGGYTEFQFEAHKYLESSVPKYAGGLRVTKILSYDKAGGVPIEKTYKYGVGESGYGVKNFLEKSFYTSATRTIQKCPFYGHCGPDKPDEDYITRSFFSYSTLGLDTQDGSPVVYPTVTEYIGNESTNIGKIVYVFDGGGYKSDVIQPVYSAGTSKAHRNSYHWQRGKLTKKTTYDQAGHLISMSNTGYTVYGERNVPIGTNVIKYITFTTGDFPGAYVTPCTVGGHTIDYSQYVYATYTQATGSMLPTVQEETIYENGDINKALKSTTTLVYDPDYLQVTTQDKVDRINTERTIKKTRYPFNYSTAGLTLTGNGRGLQMLNEKNMVSTPVEQYVIKHASDNSEQVIGGTLTTFLPNSVNNQQVQADQIFVWESTPLAVSSYSVSSLSGSNVVPDTRYKTRAKLKAFDANGNVLQVSKTNDLDISYLYGYHRSRPIAEIQNADNDEQPAVETNQSYFYNTSFSDDFTNREFTPNLKIDYDQTISITISFFKTSGTPMTPPTLKVVLKRLSDNTEVYNSGTLEVNSTTPTATVSADVTLSAGDYEFFYDGAAYGSIGNSVDMRFTINAPYKTFEQVYHSKLFHTSFEEDGTTDANAKTGNKIHSGPYSVPVPNASGSYVITWWERTGSGPWSLMKQQVSGGGGMYGIGSSSGAVDEVRVYPVNALMKTYTYDPLFGITTSTDPNNVTTYYGYDQLGRLKWIKDHEGNVLQSYEYHYQNERKPLD
jgi:YD repeat-containing protein